MAILFSISLVFVSKLDDHMTIIKKKNQSIWLKLFDLCWRIILPFAFGLTLIGPIKILCFYLADATQIKELTSLYLLSYMPIFILTMFLLIKTGKIKTTTKFK